MKLNLYAFLVSALMVVTACEDELTLAPQQSLTDADAFANKANTQSTLLGVYSTAQNLEFYGSQPQIINEYMADNTRFVGSFPTLQEIRDFNTISTNVTVSVIWERHYQVVLRANLVIANVPAVTDPAFTPAEKAQFIAEAKFMRALANLSLVNLFAQPFQVSSGSTPGIPIVTEPFTGIASFPARNTVAEVYTAIKADLTEAIVDLPVSYSTPILTRGRATKGAARALLARVHLYVGEFPQAASNALLVLNDAQYVPSSNYSNWTAKNTTEDVFTIQNSNIDNGRTGSGGWGSYHRPAANGGRGDATLSTYVIAAYEEEPNDLRYALRSAGVDANTNAAVFTTKWSDAVNNADNSPVIRTTEVLLTYVEAKAEEDGAVSQPLIDRMNVLRSRAGLPTWVLADFASKDAFVTAVLNERRKELAFEGHRRMDLLRRGQALRPASDPEFAKSVFGGPKTILPIPQREIDQNPSLTQNTGF